MTKEKVMTEDEEEEIASRKTMRTAIICFAIVEAVVTASVLLYKYLGR